MPVSYIIDTGQNTVRTTCAGPVTLPQVIEHFRVLEHDPVRPPQPDVFLDLSGMDPGSTPQADQVSRVVVEVRRVQPRLTFGACAILAPPDALFGMMRMFETLGEEYFRVTRTFRDRRDAELWLAAQQSGSQDNPTAD